MRKDEDRLEEIMLDALDDVNERQAPLEQGGLYHRVCEPGSIPRGKTGREENMLKELRDPLTSFLPLARVELEDIESLQTCLDWEFPWLRDITEKVCKSLRLGCAVGCPVVRLRPMLLYGPPGTGKTRYTRRLAELLSLPNAVWAVGGASDNRMLAGTSRGWGTGEPAEMLRLIARTKCPNPLIVLDELDKDGDRGINGRMTDTLLQLLEKETSTRWYDQYLLADCDVSKINWIATANTIEMMESWVLSRFLCFEVSVPLGEQMYAVVHGARHDFAAQWDVPYEDFPTFDEVEWLALENRFRRDKISPRALTKMVHALMERKMLGRDGALLH